LKNYIKYSEKSFHQGYHSILSIVLINMKEIQLNKLQKGQNGTMKVIL